MTKDERSRAFARIALATIAAAGVALATAPAAAQDPPPPLLPADVPPPPLPPPAPVAPPPSQPATPPPSDAPPPMALPPPTAPAPEPAAPVEPPSYSPRESRYAGSARTLNGHTFPTPFLIDSAFVQTNVGIGVEIGRQWEYGVQPPSPISMTTATPDMFQYDRTLALTTQYLSVGVAVTDRVEIGMSASYSAMIAGDVNASILFGGRTAWTLNPGVRFRLFRSSSAQMALRLYGNFGSSAWQNPELVITEISQEVNQIAGNSSGTAPGCTASRQASLADGNLGCALSSSFNSQAAAYTSQSNFGGGGMLSLAAAFTASFGLQASLGLDAGYAPSTAGGTSFASAPINFRVGVAPSIDLGPTVPLTLMGEYLLTVTNSSTVSSTADSASVTADAGSVLTIQNGVAAGVYYTGRRDLVLGALFTATFAEAEQTTTSADPTTGADVPTTSVQPPLTRLTGQINARYFF